MDEFTTAAAKVKDLQDQHDKLERAIPKLLALEAEAGERLDTLQRSEANLIEKLEKLRAEIKRRTIGWSQWFTDENEALKLQLANFESRKTEVARQLTAKEEQLNGLAQQLAEKRGKLKELEIELAERKKVADDRDNAQNELSETLTARNIEVTKGEEANASKAAELVDKYNELGKREEKLKIDEEATTKALNDAEAARKQAETLLEGSKDKVASLDQKETELDRREVLLDKREKELKSAEIALNDRRLVQQTNNPA